MMRKKKKKQNNKATEEMLSCDFYNTEKYIKTQIC